MNLWNTDEDKASALSENQETPLATALNKMEKKKA
jgi:hypothetical protein